MPINRSILWGAAILVVALLVTAGSLPGWMTFATIATLPLLALRPPCGAARSDAA